MTKETDVFIINLDKLTYAGNLDNLKKVEGHDRRYTIDATNIENEQGCQADEDFESEIVKTIE